MNKCRLERVLERPQPEAWSDDEPMSLMEAAAVLTRGALSVNGLRTAVKNKELRVRRVAGKIFTTKREVLRMLAPKDGEIQCAGEQADSNGLVHLGAAPSLQSALFLKMQQARAASIGKQRTRDAADVRMPQPLTQD